MESQFKLPKLSETGAKGTVGNILVSEGDRVTDGQSVLEVETDKAVVEVPSSVNGVVGSIHVKPGDEIQEGTPIFTFSLEQ